MKELTELISTETTAEYVGVSVRHVWRVAEELGVTPVVMFHRRMKWKKDDVLAMKRHREKRRRQ